MFSDVDPQEEQVIESNSRLAEFELEEEKRVKKVLKE